MQLNNYTIINGVYHNSLNKISDQFEKQYLNARQQEGRVYRDDEVSNLPVIPVQHPLYNEWQVRKESAKKLVVYCNKKQVKTILEVGCGNGWLSNFLAGGSNAVVAGLDINLPELEQAARVFKRPNLHFIYDEFIPATFPTQKFDLILFAASIQYFSSLKEVIDTALERVSSNGEVHVLDTNFYSDRLAESAKQRTVDYYNHLHVPEMSGHYHHHSWTELKQFNYKILYNPKNPWQKISGNKNPFPWICIRN